MGEGSRGCHETRREGGAATSGGEEKAMPANFRIQPRMETLAIYSIVTSYTGIFDAKKETLVSMD